MAGLQRAAGDGGRDGFGSVGGKFANGAGDARADVARAIESGILNPRGTWNSPGAVARDVLRVLDPIADRRGIEVGVLIFNPSENVYVIGEILYGHHSDSLNLPKLPGAVAGAHTHGGDPQHSEFSRADVNWANGVDADGLDLPGYNNRPLPLYKSNGQLISVCNPEDPRCNPSGARDFYGGAPALRRAVTGRPVP